MKRALLGATAGALGAFGAAGLMTAAPASADCSTTTPPLTPERIQCVAGEQTNDFLKTTDPFYNYNVLVYGTLNDDGTRSGLGLVDQVGTFQSSVTDFLNGPRSPDPAPDAAGPGNPPPG